MRVNPLNFKSKHSERDRLLQQRCSEKRVGDLTVSRLLLMLLFSSISAASFGQAFLDLSAGASFQDNFNMQFAIRKQFSPKFQGGFEFQYGNPKYRFVETKVMREGYAYSISLPTSILLSQEERIDLYGIARLGARFQGIIDPDGNDMRDSLLSSTAIVGEFGLISCFEVSEKIALQGGATYQLAYEISPQSLSEYGWLKLHFGGALNLNKSTVFLHTNIGNAFGASGDTYKYIWSTEIGIRFSLTESLTKRGTFIQQSF